MAITNQSGANISTSGDNNWGIAAQSLGGNGGSGGSGGGIFGGGHGGFSIGGDLDGANTKEFNGNMSISLGGSGGTGAAAGNVMVSNAGSISTGFVDTLGYVWGYKSPGLAAQSIGGGGLNVITGDTGSDAGSGSAGDVAVVNSGAIITTGAYAHGIFAQSAGGTGSAGDVVVNNYNVITVSGNGAHDIFAVCRGQSGSGQITITNYESGKITGSLDGTAPILMSGGSNNAFINYGTVTSAGALVEGNRSSFTNYGSLNGYSFFGDLINHGSLNPATLPAL